MGRTKQEQSDGKIDVISEEPEEASSETRTRKKRKPREKVPIAETKWVLVLPSGKTKLFKSQEDMACYAALIPAKKFDGAKAGELVVVSISRELQFRPGENR